MGKRKSRVLFLPQSQTWWIFFVDVFQKSEHSNGLNGLNMKRGKEVTKKDTQLHKRFKMKRIAKMRSWFEMSRIHNAFTGEKC